MFSGKGMSYNLLVLKCFSLFIFFIDDKRIQNYVTEENLLHAHETVLLMNKMSIFKNEE